MSSLRALRRGFIYAGLAWLLPRLASGSAGALDPSFGSGGIVISSLSAQEDRAFAAVLQPDDKVLVGGGLQSSPGSFDFVVARYDATGALDPTFGTGGRVVTPAGGGAEVITLLLQPDQKIVAMGYHFPSGGPYYVVLVRYLPDGTLDPSFGGGAPVITAPDAAFGSSEAALQPDGKIVVVGQTSSGGGDFVVRRFLSDGSPDLLFGVGGTVVTTISPFPDRLESVAVQPDGKIVVAGTSFATGFAMVRYDASGALDPTFGVGGIVAGTRPNYPRAMRILADGRIVIGGDTFVGSHLDLAVVRYLPNGTLDPTFGIGGERVTAVGALDDQGTALLIQPNGRIVIAGSTATSSFTASLALVRYDDAGSPDGAFGAGGIVTTPLGGFTRATGSAAVLRPDSRILVAGYRNQGGPGDFAMAQYFGNLCGDGTVEPGEACDDGNTVGGDCCSATCTYEAAGSGCADDGDACTEDVCDGAGACGHPAVTCALCETCDSSIGCIGAPRAGCLGIAPVGRSSLQLRDRVPDTSDVARWKWQSGVVAVGDFGDPLTTDDYALCVYQGASQALWLRSVAPKGGACSFKPCWKPLAQNGAKYVDRELTPDGVSSLVLRSNVPGRVQLKLKAKGSSLALPSLATLALPVRVQLQRSGGACWDVTYATAKTATFGTFAASAQ
jgi:uncharacterized delta-60 repeat protein